MDESVDRERSSSSSPMTTNCKLASDSGYGSNKSATNSQSQRSSGSSKSQHSSLSSGSSNGYPLHPNTPLQIADYKSDRKASVDKNEQWSTQEGSKETKISLEQSSLPNMGVISMPSFPGTPSQLSPGAGNLDSKALQMAALTHALCCIKKFQQEPFTNDLDREISEEALSSAVTKWQQYFSEELKDEFIKDDGFAAAVSIDDGVVMYITATITNVLGFPKDMLIGRSFIDFIHPKDRMAFASHITCGIKFPSGDSNLNLNHNSKTGSSIKSEQFFCRLRQYRGLKSIGFGVADKTVVYYPFRLTLKLKKIDETTNAESPPATSKATVNFNLVIVATRIKSAYQYPEEVPTNAGKFVTRHSANCNFGHMDTEAISYLGHLPQDLIGNSVLDYYHPEDMALLKDIYEGVMQEQGKPFRSRPYRFRVFNGSFAMLETDWSCFINPWSWKLEFVIGQHRVVQGPLNPNVFMPPMENEDLVMSEDVISDGKETQEEIKKILTESVTRRISDPIKLRSSRRRKVLAALMETLLEQIGKAENSELSGSQCSGMFSMMERDSVMLGEISPHHDDYSGSNQSSETPPSYNQLNYKENIERFFQSQPKTSRSDQSGDMSNKIETQQSSQNRSSDEDSKSSPHTDYSSGSNQMFCKSSGSNESDDRETFDTCSMILTEDVLSRHNEDMEKYMIQRHRELRGKQNSCAASQKECRHKISEKLRQRKMAKDVDASPQEVSHGVKRVGNTGWERENQTALKYPHLERQSETSFSGCTPGRSNSADLWPPFSISLTPGSTTSCSATNAGGVVRGQAGVARVPRYPLYQPTPPVVQQVRGMTQVISPISVDANSASYRPSLVFVPGQQNFIPQQVQYGMPAGVMLQPIAFQVVGSSAPLLMPNILSPALVQPGHPLARPQPLTQSNLNMITTPSPAPHPALPRDNHFVNHVVAGQSAVSTTISIQSCSVPTTNSQKCTELASSDNVNVGERELTGNKGHGSFVQSAPKVRLGQEAEWEELENDDSSPMSSSDGFGSKYLEESSSSSLNSNPKHAPSEEGTKRESKHAKEALGRYMCPSDAEGEGDQEMMWATHAEKTELAGMSLKEPRRMRSKVPPWMENLQMSEEIVYRYKIPSADVGEILHKDLQALKIFGKQSCLVNEQMSLLYKEIEMDEEQFGSLMDESDSESGEELQGRTEKETRENSEVVDAEPENLPSYLR